MPRRRDVRRFGRGPYVLALRRNPQHWGDGFPFDVPAVGAVDHLRLEGAPVTLLAGDNGTGKSTIVEAIAQAMGFAPEGGELERAGELPAVPRAVLDGALGPVLSKSKPQNGYFLRAESQAFLSLAANRFGGNGLHVLDEPEAALSVSGALALLAIVDRAARAGAQFIIATHSPILLACPRSRIYELDDAGMAPCAYDDLETVRLTRGFLRRPARFIQATLEEPEGS